MRKGSTGLMFKTTKVRDKSAPLKHTTIDASFLNGTGSVDILLLQAGRTNLMLSVVL